MMTSSTTGCVCVCGGGGGGGDESHQARTTTDQPLSLTLRQAGRQRASYESSTPTTLVKHLHWNITPLSSTPDTEEGHAYRNYSCSMEVEE